MSKQYKVGRISPSGEIEWLDKIYTAEEARQQCKQATRSLADAQDSDFRLVHAPIESEVIDYEDRAGWILNDQLRRDS